MCQAVDERHVRTRQKFQMVVGSEVRRAYEIDATWIRHDQMSALPQTALHLRGEYGVTIGGIGTDDKHDVGLHYRIEILRAGGFAEGILQSIAGWRVTHAGA